MAHYLDDFITTGSPESPVFQTNLSIMLAKSQQLGVPVAQTKCAGPVAVLVFLGFELDTNQMVIKLPEDMLHRMVRDRLGKKAYKKEDLESLLGHLQHAVTVVRPSRTFDRCFINPRRACARVTVVVLCVCVCVCVRFLYSAFSRF